MGRLTWKNNWNVYDKHVLYISNDIQKTFNRGTLENTERVCEMFELDKFLLPPIRKNEEYNKYPWDTKEMP